MSKAKPATVAAVKKSYTATKKDIKELLNNPKITFVLGNYSYTLNSFNRWTCLRQGHSMR